MKIIFVAYAAVVNTSRCFVKNALEQSILHKDLLFLNDCYEEKNKSLCKINSWNIKSFSSSI